MTFPQQATVIARLADLGIESIKGHKLTDRPGYYVDPAFPRVRGPVIHVRAGETTAWVTRKLAELLAEAGWDVRGTDNSVVVTSIPRKGN
jgi:hypothetical protein